MCSTGCQIDCWFNMWFKEMQKFRNVSFGEQAVWSWQLPWNRSQREWQHQLKVNIILNRMKEKLTKDVPFSFYLADTVLLTGQLLLVLASYKSFLLITFNRVVKANTFFKLMWVNEVFRSFPTNSLSLKQILSYARLGRYTRRQMGCLRGVPTKRDSNQFPQLQRLARKLKFCLYQARIWYFTMSE